MNTTLAFIVVFWLVAPILYCEIDILSSHTNISNVYI